MHRATLLIVDDDEDVRTGLSHTLRHPDYKLLLAESPSAALKLLQSMPVDIIISDHLMPEMTGLEFLKIVRDRFPDTVRIILTGHADTEMALKAINEGEIYRFLEKPCSPTELRVTVFLACERLDLERENRRLLALVRTTPDLMRRVEKEEQHHLDLVRRRKQFFG